MPIRRREIASGLPGGTEPASKRGQTSPAASPSSSRARAALGRMLVTPTFAVGIAVVLAACLAYSTTQTHLLFSPAAPPCETASCSTAAPRLSGGVPLRNSAKPEPGSSPAQQGAGAPQRSGAAARRIAGAPARPASGAHAPAGQSSRNPGITSVLAPIAASQSHSGSPRVTIGYQTLYRWYNGFIGAITITSDGSPGIPNWLLWLRYPHGRVDHVRGIRWYPSNRHAGVAAPWKHDQVLQPGMRVQFTFRVRGRHPGPPPGCFFNASRCGFGRSGR